MRRAIDLAISLKDNVEDEMGSLVRSIGGQFVAAGPVFIYTYIRMQICKMEKLSLFITLL